MRAVREIGAIGLSGATPEGGWSNELQEDDGVHTLIIVRTDRGSPGRQRVHQRRSGAGGARRAGAALPGRPADEPERVSELHQHNFWLGRGGSVTHTISGIDIALWDILGQITGQPVGRLLGGRLQGAGAAILPADGSARTVARSPRGIREQGFRAFKMGWGPFGRVSHA